MSGVWRILRTTLVCDAFYDALASVPPTGGPPKRVRCHEFPARTLHAPSLLVSSPPRNSTPLKRFQTPRNFGVTCSVVYPPPYRDPVFGLLPIAADPPPVTSCQFSASLDSVLANQIGPCSPTEPNRRSFG